MDVNLDQRERLRRESVARRVDLKRLARALRKRIAGEVRFDDGTRALYATDGSNYRQPPLGVVIPRDIDDVLATVETCRQFEAPLLSRGGGTSLAGQCCNLAVVMDFSKYMNRVLEIDPLAQRAVVQPGVVLDDLRAQAERHHLTFAPDPSTHNHCTLGGMIGNNSCGVHSVMAGKTSDNVEALDVVTYDGARLRLGPMSEDDLAGAAARPGREGEIYTALRALRERYAAQIRARFPPIPRRVSGYNLEQLLPEHGCHMARALVGSEGTCVVVLSALVRLVPSPRARSLLVLGYPDVYRAADHVPAILPFGPIGLEGLDERLVEDMKAKRLHPRDIRLLPDGCGWLMVEFGGDTKAESDANAQRLMHALSRGAHAPSMKLFDDDAEERTLWRVRESGLGATALVPGAARTWEGWEDSAVPPERMGDYLRDFDKLCARFGYRGALYGHFGQGCLHTRLNFDLQTHAGILRFRRFVHEAADLVVSYGGSLSGEHGDGQSRAELLPKMFGEDVVQAFREFKAIWDPSGHMNPGKLVDPYRVDDNLRLGTDYAPPSPRTDFAFVEDGGSFAEATLRCVGVGECRRLEGGTMCPSYRATREERHSTRGRARLLFEMLHGDVIHGGWREDAVHEALRLCLACKGCKGDCPVNVDMATYKAEFMSHYYEKHARPRASLSMGHIQRWARIGATVPRLANFFTHAPVISRLTKAIAGVTPKRAAPRFAAEPFTTWFARRGTRTRGRTPVILWPDTFNNHFYPHTLMAGVDVLEAAGFEVRVPLAPACCGRPLYDFGLLDKARAQLRELLAVLRAPIRAGIPVVVLEPSCMSVFQDELVNLLPHDQDAHRLRQQSFLLPDFLVARRFRPPLVTRRALVHGHCHHKAIMKFDGERRLLADIGLDCDVLDSGCCGLAGSFGFERDERYDVSIACAEAVLAPAVRAAADDTLIVADGFSCREQIAHTTGRHALHVAEVLSLGLKQSIAR